jgi:hypothetical protein
MPKFNPVDAKDFTDQLLAAGFVADGVLRFHERDDEAAAILLEKDGIKVVLTKNVPGKKYTAQYSGITHERFPRPIRQQQECIDHLIKGAAYNKDFRNKTKGAIDLILESFRATGTPLEARTTDLPRMHLAYFFLGKHIVAYLAKTSGAHRHQGIFKFVATEMFQLPGYDDELEDGDEPEGPRNYFYFSNTSQFLCRIEEMFTQEMPKRKYEVVGNEVATLLNPGAFLDVAFEYGLSWVSEKCVGTFRTAHCATTDRLLDGDKKSVTLYALGFKAAPAKL